MTEQSTPRQSLIEKISEVVKTPTDRLIRNSKADQNKGVLIYNEIENKIEELKERQRIN